jgi:hypothetical protein
MLHLAGTVDYLNLMEELLKPRWEVYVMERVSWSHGVEGARRSEISEYVVDARENSKYCAMA